MSIYFWFYEDELLYIGSSMNIGDRLNTYKSNDRLSKQTSFNKQLKEKGIALKDLEFEEVKTGINNRNELEILEGKCQMLYNPKFNKTIAGGMGPNYVKRDTDHRRESQKKWWELNKERINTERKRNRSLKK